MNVGKNDSSEEYKDSMQKHIEWQLKMHIAKVKCILQNTPEGLNLDWLNNICRETKECFGLLHEFLKREMLNDTLPEIENIFLALRQAVISIRRLEITINQERKHNKALRQARKCFMQRLIWSFSVLGNVVKRLSLEELPPRRKEYKDYNWVELLDLLIDHIKPFTTDANESDGTEMQNATDEEVSQECNILKGIIAGLIEHALAFGNVGMMEDKYALTSLCRIVLREQLSFTAECEKMCNAENYTESDRKMKAMNLEQAVYKLDDYLNNAILRLTFSSFYYFKKNTVMRMRQAFNSYAADSSHMIALCSDFDINLDRLSQIGEFAIAHAQKLKTRVILRSCLITFETLDSTLIPALQVKDDVFSHLLEDHFNEELDNYRQGVVKILDSFAFTACYRDMLTACIVEQDKLFDLAELQAIHDMADFVFEHFAFREHKATLTVKPLSLKYLEDFKRALQQCQQAIHCYKRIERSRIIKRFKTLRSVVEKFIDTIKEPSTKREMTFFHMPVEEAEYKASSLLLSAHGYACNELQRSTLHAEQLVQPEVITTTDTLPAPKMARVEQLCQRSVVNGGSEQMDKPSESAPQVQASASKKHKKREGSLRRLIFQRTSQRKDAQLYACYRKDSQCLEIKDLLDNYLNLSSKLIDFQ